MHRSPRLVLVACFALFVVLAACGTAETPSPSIEAAPSRSPETTASVTPSEAETASAEPSAPATGGSGPSGFSVAPHPEADALFLDRDECENLEDGYRLEYPDDWYTNTEIGSVPPCSWFSPTFYEVDDPSDVPDEIAIEIFVIEGDRGYLSDPITREEVVVGATQTAVRTEVEGTSGGEDRTTYEYVVQLGPTLEEGPNLVARTDTDMGGDYELNKAVLDRIMSTIEFIGTIQ